MPLHRATRGMLGQRRRRKLLQQLQARALHDLETRQFADWSEARREIFRWVAFYNRRRRHSRANYLSPVDYEVRYTEAANSNTNSATLIPVAAETWCPLPGERPRPSFHPSPRCARPGVDLAGEKEDPKPGDAIHHMGVCWHREMMLGKGLDGQAKLGTLIKWSRHDSHIAYRPPHRDRHLRGNASLKAIDLCWVQVPWWDLHPTRGVSGYS